MESYDPGNINRGFCLKCKEQLFIDLPDENRVRLLCDKCTREVQEFIRHSKNKANIKRIIIHGNKYKVKHDARSNNR